ncbi:MAG: hypothetical protein COB04_08135 [Gammaproteobacteria bacterium]|nr:MAG: hypothetical protein COB04_08135 [Gammaproteobacteria bacterium]
MRKWWLDRGVLVHGNLVLKCEYHADGIRHKSHKLKHLLQGLSLLAVLFASPSYAVNWSDVTLNGYFSFEYEKNVSGEPEGDTNGSFDLDLFDLVINFNVSDNFRIATDLTWEHGAATEEDFGNVAVEYAFGEYTFNRGFKLRAGKMFTNFGIYNEIHTAKPATLTVKEPLSTNKNNKLGSEFRFYPRWNVGIAAVGDFIFMDRDFDYVVQLSNGEDEETNPYEEDVNTSKALGARVRGDVSDVLQLGASFYKDHINSDYDDDGDLLARARIASYGVQVRWSPYELFQTEFEYVAGTVKRDDTEKISRKAYTVMFSSELTEEVTPYLRIEMLEPNTDVSDDQGMLTIVGVNWQITTNAFLKFELNSTDTEEANAKFEGQDFKEFKASLSVGF